MKLPELEVGDIALVGKFKNRKVTIEGFGKDKNNQPTILTDKGEYPVFKIRLQKLMASLKIGESRVLALDNPDALYSKIKGHSFLFKEKPGVEYEPYGFSKEKLNPKEKLKIYMVTLNGFLPDESKTISSTTRLPLEYLYEAVIKHGSKSGPILVGHSG